MPRDNKPRPDSDPLAEELTDLDPFDRKETDPRRVTATRSDGVSDFEQMTTQRGGDKGDSWDEMLEPPDPLELVATDLGASTSDAEVRHGTGEFSGDAEGLLLGGNATPARWADRPRAAPDDDEELEGQPTPVKVRLPKTSDAFSTSLWTRKAPQLSRQVDGDKPVIADRYEVVKPLGSGGMGRILLVRHVNMGKEFALKIMHKKLHTDARIQERFFSEAKFASTMDHPNIVQMTDFGVDTKHGAYIVMELLRGETLLDRLETQRKLRLDLALEVTLQTAEALHYMHQQDVIHCDIKPENIFLCRPPKAGRHAGPLIKLLDFGLSHPLMEDAKLAEGEVAGTPQYMAPEQIQRVAPTPVMDIYSLGVLLYEMLTGELPFAGSPYEVLEKKLLDEAPAPSEQLSRPLDLFVEGFIMRTLSKDPALRPQSMGEVIYQLRTFMQMEGFEKPRWRASLTAGVDTAARQGEGEGPGGETAVSKPPRPGSETSLEEQQERAQIETIFTLCPLPLFLLDADGVLLRANVAFANFVNASRSDLVGEPLERSSLQLVYSDFRTEFDEWVASKRPKPLTRILVLPPKKGSRNVMAMFVLVAKTDRAGKVKHVVGTIHSLGKEKK